MNFGLYSFELVTIFWYFKTMHFSELVTFMTADAYQQVGAFD